MQQITSQKSVFALAIRWIKRLLIAVSVLVSGAGMVSVSKLGQWEIEDYFFVAFVQGNLVLLWLNQAFKDSVSSMKRIGTSIVYAFLCFGGGNLFTFLISIFRSPDHIELSLYKFLVFVGGLCIWSIFIGTFIALLYIFLHYVLKNRRSYG